jgi:hypothetical protein
VRRVPLYPRPLQSRHAQATAQLRQQVTKLQTRTAVIDSSFPLATLPAIIDHGYPGSGNPMVYANGATTLTGPYACLGSYTPKAGDNVLLQPVPALATYVVAGNPTVPPVSLAWQQVTLTGGWTGTVQYRWLDLLASSVQLDGQVGLPASGGYNDTQWGAVAGAYSPGAARNWPAIPMSATTYGNASYPGGPHCFAEPGGDLYLWGIPASLNSTNVNVSGIYAI